MDLTDDEDGGDENDEKVLVSQKMHQVSLLAGSESGSSPPVLTCDHRASPCLSVCVCACAPQRMVALLRQLQLQLKKERAEAMLMEGQVREEVSQEFSKLFSEMQDDFK